MFRHSVKLSAMPFGSYAKDMMFGLWKKPETQDSRVKDYVPEVLEESLAEQRAVLEESTTRDVIVELGHKVLRAIENKSPTPSIAPNLNSILKEFGASELINQRALSYLLYPNSSAGNAGSQQQPELVSSWADNFRAFIGHIEENGSSVHIRQKLLEDAKQDSHGDNQEKIDATTTKTTKDIEVDSDSSEAVPPPVKPKEAINVGQTSAEAEPFDVSMLAKVSAGMALANIQCSDNAHALKCVDFALTHSTDATRRGGLYGMKAGVLNRLKRYEEASQAANLAIEASDNVQGYLQGAAALRMLKKDVELVSLLERGTQAHPAQTLLLDQLDAQKKTMGLSLSA